MAAKSFPVRVLVFGAGSVFVLVILSVSIYQVNSIVSIVRHHIQIIYFTHVITVFNCMSLITNIIINLISIFLNMKDNAQTCLNNFFA